MAHIIADNYISLLKIPPTPKSGTPTSLEAHNFEFITMVQLCNIAEKVWIDQKTSL